MGPLYSRLSSPPDRGLLLPLRSLSDGALFAETYGEGSPRVLALHGWARRGKDFSQALAGIPALAVDLPGFGASPAPDFVIGADGYADIVGEILPQFDRPPVLVGHSFGGRVATCLAAKNPGSFADLVLTGAPVVRAHAPRGPSMSFRLIRSLNRLGVVSDDRMEQLRRRRGSADYRSASGVMRDILVKVISESYEGQLKELKCDVTLVWGSDDREVPAEVARIAAEMIGEASGPDRPNVSVKVLEGVGHNVPLQAPGALREIIIEHMAEDE